MRTIEGVIMKEVESSNLKEVGYNSESRELYITFVRGGTYKYSPISEQGHRELMASDSKGHYFSQNIKDNSTITTTKL